MFLAYGDDVLLGGGLMATPAEIERQVKFERDAIRQGVEKLRKNTADLEKLSPMLLLLCMVVASIQSALPLIIKRIEDTSNQGIREGKLLVTHSKRFVSILNLLNLVLLLPLH